MAKKHLGQNFLKSKKAINTMVSGAEVNNLDTVLEIGPGKGAITVPLLETGANIVAIEKDPDLMPILEEKTEKYSNFALKNMDVLDFDTKILGEYKLVANIPYYITGAIIRYFLENKNPPKTMVLLIQKEVAQRITAQNGKESILSLSVKAYGNPKILMKVNRKDFSPSPDVDSAIIAVSNISKDFFDGFSEKEFFHVIKNAFQFKRKTIYNNLKGVFPDIEDTLKSQGISPKTRAEDIHLFQWQDLIKALV